MNKIIIKEFGPVGYFEETLGKKLNILIGQQATGKSTIVKLIYFCESIRDELVKFLFNEKIIVDSNIKQLLFEFSKSMVTRFNHFFGSTKHFSNFEVIFYFGGESSLIISKNNNGYLSIKFNDKLKNIIHGLMSSYKNYYCSIDSPSI